MLQAPRPPGWWGTVWKLRPGRGPALPRAGLVSLGERLREMAALTALCTVGDQPDTVAGVRVVTKWATRGAASAAAVESVTAAGLPAWGVEPPAGHRLCQLGCHQQGWTGCVQQAGSFPPRGASVRPGLGLLLGLDGRLPTVSSQGRPCVPPALGEGLCQCPGWGRRGKVSGLSPGSADAH